MPDTPYPAAPPDWRLPTAGAAAWRAAKVAALVALRGVRNVWSGPRRWPASDELAGAPVIAQQSASLWDDGRADEFLLRAGKVQNLRRAARAFHGVVVPAGQVFSFWAQLGRMSGRRGFAVGREIISGCVVPTMGGGICQLSNALAQAAVASGITLTEWHRHSARIEAAQPLDVDATVAWNYVDLRLRAPFAFRIEVALSATTLTLRLRAVDAAGAPGAPGASASDAAPARAPKVLRIVPAAPSSAAANAAATNAASTNAPPVARGCLTCDETSCFRHQPDGRHVQARRALALHQHSAEAAAWAADWASRASAAGGAGAQVDWVLGWERPTRRRWAPAPGQAVRWLRAPAWRRMAFSAWQRLRRHAGGGAGGMGGEGGARQRGLQRHADDLGRAIARALRPEQTELALTQDLLVPLWRAGALGGRAFDVWLDALPAAELQRRLDQAAQRHPEAASLRDFRVDATWARDEALALAAARQCVTAHADVARVLQAQGLPVQRRPWHMPAAPAVGGSAPMDNAAAAATPVSASDGGTAIAPPATGTRVRATVDTFAPNSAAATGGAASGPPADASVAASAGASLGESMGDTTDERPSADAPPRPPTLVFPASALARKGSLTVAAVARRLHARVIVLGTPPAAQAPEWSGVDWRPMRYTDPAWLQADAVLLPAWVEHRPQTLRRALAAGLPVVATPACGLDAQAGLRLVPPGDDAATLAALLQALSQRRRDVAPQGLAPLI